MNHFISKTLGIKDENIEFQETVDEKVIKGIRSLIYYAKLSYTPKRCVNCGFENKNYSIVKNGTKKSRLVINKISERPAYLILYKQRFHCKLCDAHFTAESNCVEKYCFISNNTKLAVIHKSTKIRSEKSIAESCFISATSVSRFIKQAAKEVNHNPMDSLPAHIMMDEFKSVKNVSGAMSFIFADALTHRIVDIVEDRRLFSLKNYFLRFPLKERKKVQTITIDMYEPYISLIKSMFPNAKIIVDRFHIIQLLNRALNMARVNVMNTFRRTNPPLYNKYKGYWKLLLTPEEKLENFEYKKFRLFKELKTEKGIVEYLLSMNSELAETHSLVNNLRHSLKNNDSNSFFNTLFNTDTTTVHHRLKSSITTLRKYKSYIDNTIYYSNLTNGPLEGTNNKIKLIKRVSFGYRNYNNLKNRVLLCSRLYLPESKKEIKQHKVVA
ncbi:ISL3 family transposase [Macrococcus equi]